jgi:dihydroneopterin triphosphate aldolase (PTPS-III) / 6-pyruvoyltetrahydropterin synthase
MSTVPVAATYFEVHVSKDTFKFNAAHFVAFDNYRERLHGHNYRVGVRLLGTRSIGSDGYLMDFGHVKTVANAVCKQLNERFLCPALSDVLEIVTTDTTVTLNCQDGSQFVMPLADCAMLPIVHATAEELAIYLYSAILHRLSATYMIQRGIHTMQVTVAEAVGQEAVFRHEIPADTEHEFDVRTFLTPGKVVPMPCFQLEVPKQCDCKQNESNFSKQLESLAQAINDGSIASSAIDGGGVTAQDLQEIVLKQRFEL